MFSTLLILLAGCGGDAPPAAPAMSAPAMAPPMELVLKSSRIVDLSHPLTTDLPTLPGRAGFSQETVHAREEGGVLDTRFCAGDESGTSLLSPAHLSARGASVDALPIEQLMGAAAVVDGAAGAATNPAWTLSLADLEAFEARQGKLGAGRIFFLRTGWGARWSEPERYLSLGEDGVPTLPGLSTEAAQALLDRGVRVVGTDAPRLCADDCMALLAEGGASVVLSLANLEQIPEAGATVVVAPLPVAGAAGSPARVFAIVPTGGPGPMPAAGHPPMGNPSPTPAGGPPGGGSGS